MRPTSSVQPNSSSRQLRDAHQVGRNGRSVPNYILSIASLMENPDKLVKFLSPMVCMCATMYRIDPPHLAWSLENIQQRYAGQCGQSPRRNSSLGSCCSSSHARSLLKTFRPSGSARARPYFPLLRAAMTSTQSSASPSFWRCDHCGTPNPSAGYVRTCLGCGAIRPSRGTETDAAKSSHIPRLTERRHRKILLGSAIGYGLVILLASLMARVVGDAWWPGLVLLMSPRWLFLIPAMPLLFCSWHMKRPLIGGMIVVEVLFILGPLMGFGLPWGRLGKPVPRTPTLRIMTFNRGGGSNDTARFAQYLERHKIDVVCFQEFGPDPTLDTYFESVKWHRNSSRSIASRYPILAELPRPDDYNLDQQRYTMNVARVQIQGPQDRVFVVASVHLPTLRPGFNRLFQGDIAGLRLQADWWGQEMTRLVDVITDSGRQPILLAGDFNLPVESTGLASLLDNGVFQSAFEEAGLGWGYTRPAGLPWVRIDHVFASVDWTVTRCWVGPSFGSDHRSLVAELAFPLVQSARP